MLNYMLFLRITPTLPNLFINWIHLHIPCPPKEKEGIRIKTQEHKYIYIDIDEQHHTVTWRDFKGVYELELKKKIASKTTNFAYDWFSTLSSIRKPFFVVHHSLYHNCLSS
ncbi:hypothetical protein ISN45_Aa05g008350 [Arabidopsis thaliana x Arabidopsis arenosa]|nr:hypothetical protein ISN45_Aa05g008350 [Arabidopsis thaliana x Arabidopsis arenosa]KAG7559237.1 hypothetical protein ISN45_Aa05g008350 [Arabidopsis thaliana x Arabidopsis arenosa]